MTKVVRVIVINLVVLMVLLASVEGLAWVGLKFANTFLISSSHLAVTEHDSDTASMTTFVTDPQIVEDYANEVRNGYVFRSYLMFANRPFRSKTVNNDEKGARANGASTIKAHTQKRLIIWAFGSSSLYGARGNADWETMPAHLERLLNEQLPDTAVQVINYGVRGYSSAQDLIQFTFRLAEEPKPDFIIIYNGFNDFANIFTDSIYESSVVHKPLSYYWDFHEKRRVINWPMLGNRISELLPNTVEFLQRSARYLTSVAAEQNLEEAKRNYLAAAEAERKKVEARFQLGRRFYLTNVDAILAIAVRHGIRSILVQQPILWATTKTLFGSEQLHMQGFMRNITALTSEELDNAAKLDSSWLRQAHLYPRDLFLSGWHQQRDDLEALAARYDASFVDAQAVADHADIPVWNTDVHLTDQGNALIARSIADAVVRCISSCDKPSASDE